MNYYIFYLIIFSFAISKDFNNFFHIELNYSNLANSVYNGQSFSDADKSNQVGVKVSFSRLDSNNISSGMGIQYIPNTDTSLIDYSNSSNPTLYGLSLHSFLYKNFWFIDIGIESIYHLGSTGKDFIFGPRVGCNFDLFGTNVNIIYFIGYIDVINFERYNDGNDILDLSNPVSQIGFSILFPRGNN